MCSPTAADAQQPGEIGDLLHLRQPRRPRGRRHQADGPGDRWGCRRSSRPRSRRRRRVMRMPKSSSRARNSLACRFVRVAFVRGVELDRGNAQFAGHFQPHAQAGVDAGKHAQGPFFHRSCSSLTFPAKLQAVRQSLRAATFLRITRSAHVRFHVFRRVVVVDLEPLLLEIDAASPLPGGHVGSPGRSRRRPWPPSDGNGAGSPASGGGCTRPNAPIPRCSRGRRAACPAGRWPPTRDRRSSSTSSAAAPFLSLPLRPRPCVLLAVSWRLEEHRFLLGLDQQRALGAEDGLAVAAEAVAVDRGVLHADLLAAGRWDRSAS